MAVTKRLPKKTSAMRSGSAVQADSRCCSEAAAQPWRAMALLCLFPLLLVTSGFSLYAFHRVHSLGGELRRVMSRMEWKIERVDAGVRFDSNRRRLLLGIRDEIMRANPRIALHEAYRYASLIVNASEEYPTVEPLLLLAIGVVESGYSGRATSPANARGLYQLWPSTARMLARMQGWEYTDEMLYDPESNTEMAALYLDILFSTYHDASLVLAEYNGGPLNAGYLRAGSEKAAAETRTYVDKVLDVYGRLQSELERGIDPPLQPPLETLYRDRRREGKRLGEPPRSARARSTRKAGSGR